MSTNIQNLCIAAILLAVTCLTTLGVHAAKAHTAPQATACQCED